jgi:hypothetical protein
LYKKQTFTKDANVLTSSLLEMALNLPFTLFPPPAAVPAGLFSTPG